MFLKFLFERWEILALLVFERWNYVLAKPKVLKYAAGSMKHNVDVYGLWHVSAQTFPDKNRLWKIRRIFQVWTDQAIAYILCCQ